MLPIYNGQVVDDSDDSDDSDDGEGGGGGGWEGTLEGKIFLNYRNHIQELEKKVKELEAKLRIKNG